MAYCRECGQELIEGSKFCNNCGTQVEPKVEEIKVDPIPQYYDPYAELQKNGKNPTCGRVGLWMMLGGLIVEFLMAFIVAFSGIRGGAAALILTPILYFVFLASVVLAIVSLARGERKAPGVVTLSVLGGLLLLAIIAGAAVKL